MTLTQNPTLVLEETTEQSSRKPRLSWVGKFRVAFRGLKLGIRGHSSFFVHFFFTALVLAAAAVFRCTQIEWVMLLFCIGLVLTTELVNSSIETFFRGLDDATKDRTWPALDVAAGAVLLASLFAILIGLVIFIPKLVIWLEIPSLIGS
jgi:diacylglycerol kinase